MMRVFKFGGASVKDADGVRNLKKVLDEVGHKDIILVISAMGKTTNAMETIVNAYFEERSAMISHVTDILEYHHGILRELFPNTQHPVYARVRTLADEIKGFLAWNKSLTTISCTTKSWAMGNC